MGRHVDSWTLGGGGRQAGGQAGGQAVGRHQCGSCAFVAAHVKIGRLDGCGGIGREQKEEGGTNRH